MVGGWWLECVGSFVVLAVCCLRLVVVGWCLGLVAVIRFRALRVLAVFPFVCFWFACYT